MCESLLSALDLNTEDKIIAIRENKLADATFILASVMSKCISENKNICLVTLHNTFSHYQNIGRRLGFDLSKHTQENHFQLVDPLNDIVEDLFSINETNKYYSVDPKIIAKKLFSQIYNQTEPLLVNNEHCCVIIDDLSHLIDLGLDLKLLSHFVQHLVDFTLNKDVAIVVNCHATSPVGDILANLLFYSADLRIVVSALKTGRSKNVSGVLNVIRNCEYSTNNASTYHYKLMEKDIRVFAPGRAFI